MYFFYYYWYHVLKKNQSHLIPEITPRQHPKIIGFILSNSGSSSPVRSFAVTVDEIEKRTGIDFFPQLEDGVENQIEGVVNYGGRNL